MDAARLDQLFGIVWRLFRATGTLYRWHLGTPELGEIETTFNEFKAAVAAFSKVADSDEFRYLQSARVNPTTVSIDGLWTDVSYACLVQQMADNVTNHIRLAFAEPMELHEIQARNVFDNLPEVLRVLGPECLPRVDQHTLLLGLCKESERAAAELQMRDDEEWTAEIISLNDWLRKVTLGERAFRKKRALGEIEMREYKNSGRYQMKRSDFQAWKKPNA
jgi:hypothetical protein